MRYTKLTKHNTLWKLRVKCFEVKVVSQRVFFPRAVFRLFYLFSVTKQDLSHIAQWISIRKNFDLERYDGV